MKDMKLSGSDILVRTLIDQGVEVVFGYPGGQVINIYDSLYKYRDELTHVLTAHEQGATHAADGYARSTGRVGVVIATSGPGATNLVTGIATAFLDSIPMVAITGNVPNSSIGTDAFQETDITGVTLPITKHNYFVGSIDELEETVREAFVLASSDRPGPVLVDIPKDVQTAMFEYEPKQPYQKDPKNAAKDIRIQEAAKTINEAKKPFIYVGGGVIASEAEKEVMKLAEKVDGVIGCSMMGLSAIPTAHPRFLGMQGMHGHYASSVAMHNADLIIALGNRFNDRSTGNLSKFAVGTKIVHIDIDGAELSKNVPDTNGLRGDVALTLQKLIPLLDQKKNPEWQAQVRKYRDEEAQRTDTRPGLTPRNVILTVNGHLSPTTPVATDVGQHQMWAAQSLVFRTPRTFISSGGLGTMGFGMGAAMGAAYGTGLKTVLITGDGSFGMNLNELATAATYNVPIVIVLMNNGVLGMVRQWQTLFFDKHYSNTTTNRKTDFVKLADAFGVKGEKVGSVEELDEALTRGFAADGPYFIECDIDKDEFVMPMLPPGGSMDDIITEAKAGD